MRGRMSISSPMMAALVLVGVTTEAITAPHTQPTQPSATSQASRDGSRDFDFEIGE